ncbi:ribonuclease T [Enterobacteriaceae endosymbiont of Neohaemonia nigricornis]|uniref:ribonuclease T n=1 Tax=Enterobacteriaceae endosymbiont of Neohaemonia nigricornis TaxID=2675792 RepID=UPI001449EDD8|nr:ribonuclease T [Enterobacteriaceae endosymbiont of Neohaemonia nigricornis]QJC30315.1 ribonuclease T [Enterobacteriaceae endosymbiont of Neohaemonia nigricornis]
MNILSKFDLLSHRFRGLCPVVVDIETSGFNSKKNAILEISLITLKMIHGWLSINKTLHFHISPFKGAHISHDAITFNKINIYSALRGAITEHEAFTIIFSKIWKYVKKNNCKKAILVAHNASFDHSFIIETIKRIKMEDTNPFHNFAMFDTATLSGLMLGQTVLAKSCKILGIPFDNNQAHSALYDTNRTAILFCKLVNIWKKIGYWPLNNIKLVKNL